MGAPVLYFGQEVGRSRNSMLDAFIIERIRRERQPRETERIPLHIEIPREPHGPDRSPARSDEDEPPRGPIVIDFTL